uniref:Pentacotripeptide-repeat region of PRORP domain-containing protein n=1 Tax=Chromera velia CCMP2878 TaxID=1169474 RepID=A0A0G4I3C0_9ALVE|eukprot:Cvel_10627.t1-p1 / transcript=Cvel_10627.t1 / gene=Cvel_10627 / organism=Chromera_velia_CCMP2878 / gene_product=Pentatricopeptide repeat-containing protein, putative / transcript_product=Pentatricopeptide repeat-containing protein, putative / location=Cvel_scaffold645:39684-42587(-) / protein_length=936 / sequence_SO=supercontig / SO=protein_coding / is_pseudo=false
MLKTLEKLKTPEKIHRVLASLSRVGLELQTPHLTALMHSAAVRKNRELAFFWAGQAIPSCLTDPGLFGGSRFSSFSVPQHDAVSTFSFFRALLVALCETVCVKEEEGFLKDWAIAERLYDQARDAGERGALVFLDDSLQSNMLGMLMKRLKHLLNQEGTDTSSGRGRTSIPSAVLARENIGRRAMRLFEDMESCGILPSSLSTALFLSILSECDTLVERVGRLLEKERGSLTIDETSLPAALRCLGRGGFWRQAVGLFEENNADTETRTQRQSPHALAALFSCLTAKVGDGRTRAEGGKMKDSSKSEKNEKADTAWRIFLQEVRLPACSDWYGGGKEGRDEGLLVYLSLLGVFQSNGAWEMSLETLRHWDNSAASVALHLKRNKTSTTTELFEAHSAPIKVYNAILDAMAKAPGGSAWKAALSLFREAGRRGVRRDEVTLSSLLEALGRARGGSRWREAVQVFEETAERGSEFDVVEEGERIKVTSVSYSALLRTLERALPSGGWGVFALALRFSYEMEERGLEPDNRSAGALLSCYGKAVSIIPPSGSTCGGADLLLREIREFFDRQIARGLHPNVTVFSAYANSVGKALVRRWKEKECNTNEVLHARSSYESLSGRMLSQMREFDIRPNEFTFRALLQVLRRVPVRGRDSLCLSESDLASWSEDLSNHKVGAQPEIAGRVETGVWVSGDELPEKERGPEGEQQGIQGGVWGPGAEPDWRWRLRCLWGLVREADKRGDPSGCWGLRDSADSAALPLLFLEALLEMREQRDKICGEGKEKGGDEPEWVEEWKRTLLKCLQRLKEENRAFSNVLTPLHRDQILGLNRGVLDSPYVYVPSGEFPRKGESGQDSSTMSVPSNDRPSIFLQGRRDIQVGRGSGSGVELGGKRSEEGGEAGGAAADPQSSICELRQATDLLREKLRLRVHAVLCRGTPAGM